MAAGAQDIVDCFGEFKFQILDGVGIQRLIVVTEGLVEALAVDDACRVAGKNGSRE